MATLRGLPFHIIPKKKHFGVRLSPRVIQIIFPWHNNTYHLESRIMRKNRA